MLRVRAFLKAPLETFGHLKREPSIHKSCFVHQSAIIDGNVSLASDVSVWPGVILRGDLNAITVGEGSNIQDGTVVHVRGHFPGKQKGLPTTIGSGVTIAHRVCLHGCTIESGSLVGIGAIVLDGAVVKTGTLVAAGSVVPPGKVLDPGLWAGTPAKRLRDLTPEEKAMIKWNAEHYVELGVAWKEAGQGIK